MLRLSPRSECLGQLPIDDPARDLGASLGPGADGVLSQLDEDWRGELWVVGMENPKFLVAYGSPVDRGDTVAVAEVGDLCIGSPASSRIRLRSTA